LKEEPEDDEVPEKAGPPLKAKVRSNTEDSVDHDTPLPVRAASQKAIEQPSSLEVKEDFEEPSKPSQDLADSRRFPPFSGYVELGERAESLPDIIHITFEEATEDVTLAGWEDSWFSDVEFDVQKWGELSEPKIDFVYTCKAQNLMVWVSANFQRGQWFRRSIPGHNLAIRTELHFER